MENQMTESRIGITLRNQCWKLISRLTMPVTKINGARLEKLNPKTKLGGGVNLENMEIGSVVLLGDDMFRRIQ
jgi:hypothetical protein